MCVCVCVCVDSVDAESNMIGDSFLPIRSLDQITGLMIA